jgi:hypothetical protein
MDKGFLITRKLFWSNERHSGIVGYPWHVFTKGVETIAWKTLTSLANVEACRCNKCKIVVFSYQGNNDDAPQQTT